MNIYFILYLRYLWITIRHLETIQYWASELGLDKYWIIEIKSNATN